MEELSKGEKGQGYSTSRAAERAKMAAQIITLVTRKVHETEVLERQKRERLEDMKEARQKAEQLKIDMEVCQLL